MVGPAGRHQHRLGPHQPEAAGAHVDHQHAGQPFFAIDDDHRDGAGALKLFDRAAQNLSISLLMISMPVRSPLCTVRSAVCPAKAF